MSRRAGQRRVARAIAGLWGAGRSPLVPGTAGTLATLPAALLASRLLPWWGFLAVTFAVAALAIWSADIATQGMRGRDPQWIVVDEAAGMFVTLLFVPPGLFTVVIGFVLFRLMDILKPFPAAQAERLPGGWGVVMDDLIAGVYANLALRAAGTLYVRLLG